MPQQGSRSERPQSPCIPCHPARWARSLGHNGFYPHEVEPVHSPAPSRPQYYPAGPSCHHTLCPSVQHATPPTGRHIGWAHQPDEPGIGLCGRPQVRRGHLRSASPLQMPSTHLTPPQWPRRGRGLGIWMTLENLLLGSQLMAPQRLEGFALWWPQRSSLGGLE